MEIKLMLLIKFLPADPAQINDIYFCTKSVLDSCLAPFDDTKESLLYRAYRRIKEKISCYKRVRLMGVNVAHYLFYDNGSECVLEDLYVYDGYVNMGIGSAIVQRCISETEKPIRAEVYGDNYPAMRLFKRMGFVEKEQQGSCHVMIYVDK